MCAIGTQNEKSHSIEFLDQVLRMRMYRNSLEDYALDSRLFFILHDSMLQTLQIKMDRRPILMMNTPVLLL